MKISTRLLRWYAKHGRTLPWRETSDPYAILVSEIMLQQTQVPRVRLFYKTWMNKFPNWEALAKATNADVIHAWAGLGYNRRALMLRDIARQVMEKGEPQSQEEWIALKGVGPYTSAALSVFTLKKRVLPIDTNIRRVIGRVFFGIPYPQPKNDQEYAKKGAEEILQGKNFPDIPQALFDLATTHCTKIPSCAACPLRAECLAAKAFESGEIEAPKQMIRKARERKHHEKPHPDRIYRGRILALVRTAEAGVPEECIGSAIDPDYREKRDAMWVRRMLDRLEHDGLLRKHENTYHLPK